MPDNPTVCCIMLTKDRAEMAARAVKCFREQTYEHKKLFILNTGENDVRAEDIVHVWLDDRPSTPKTIGALRNYANSWAQQGDARADIIAHWDDDDWSHPNRLAEQVALLQSSGADLVGYNECLFWDTRKYVAAREHRDRNVRIGGDTGSSVEGLVNEAWLYRYPNPAYCLGSSFLYWRKAWERQPFDDVNHGEDERFRLKVKSVGVSAMLPPGQGPAVRVEIPRDRPDDPIITPVLDAPRMICAIHGGNTSHYAPERDRAMWRRAENWDATCERMMRL